MANFVFKIETPRETPGSSAEILILNQVTGFTGYSAGGVNMTKNNNINLGNAGHSS